MFRTLPHSHTLTLGFAVVVAALGACAQASSPPGSPPDKEPPRVVTTVPEQRAVVPNFSGPVRIRFDKTLSERGARLDEVILVSPEVQGLDVHRGGRELRIQPKGGWQKGRVYHVTVLPGLQDRFGNVRNAAFELVFSTGPAIDNTALGGIVLDRLTERPVQNARVSATSVNDSVTYTTLTDTGGFYALRSLPISTYRVMAFVDQNRNRKPDNLEARDIKHASITTTHDTIVTEFSLLALDTTPARLLRAEARDSQQVRLFFDDFMEPDVPLAGVRVTLFQLPDSTPVAGGTLMTVRDYQARQRLLHPDTTAARRDTVAAPAALRGAAPDSAHALPTQELVWQPLAPLTPRTRYRVMVQGVRNITGIGSGGGSVAFETPSRLKAPPADSTKRLPIRRDTTRTPAVKPDTSKNPRPTAPKPLKPDTSRVRN